jgi:peptidoglycan/LPS O-acetylase OafA/YrhL
MNDASIDAAPPANQGASRRYLPVLDGLRGIAVLSVMIHHGIMVSTGDRPRDALYRVATLGWIGVDIFFVLSGFLITEILIDSRGGPHYFRNFYVRRGLRIFPLYYGVLGFLLILAPPLHIESASDVVMLREHQLWYLAYTVNLLVCLHPDLGVLNQTGHFWSLSVEEQFYLLWPALVAFLPRRGVGRICAVLIVTACVLRAALVARHSSTGWIYTMLPTRVDTLAAGALLALAVRSPGMAAVARRWLPVIGGFSVVAILAVFALDPAHSFGFWNRRVQAFGFEAVTGFSASLVGSLVLSAKPSPLNVVCESRALRWLGRRSYSLYIVHLPLMWYLVNRRFGPLVGRMHWTETDVGHLLFTAIGIGLSIALAIASWHLIEQPLLRWKKQFPYETAASRASVGKNQRPCSR